MTTGLVENSTHNLQKLLDLTDDYLKDDPSKIKSSGKCSEIKSGYI